MKCSVALKPMQRQMILLIGDGKVVSLLRGLGQPQASPRSVAQVDNATPINMAVQKWPRAFECVIVVLQHDIDVVLLEQRHPVLSIGFASTGSLCIVVHTSERRVCWNVVDHKQMRTVCTLRKAAVKPIGLFPSDWRHVPGIKQNQAEIIAEIQRSKRASEYSPSCNAKKKGPSLR